MWRSEKKKQNKTWESKNKWDRGIWGGDQYSARPENEDGTRFAVYVVNAIFFGKMVTLREGLFDQAHMEKWFAPPCFGFSM